eukprot:8027588-Ditylum_brightwellii.AAC.1
MPAPEGGCQGAGRFLVKCPHPRVVAKSLPLWSLRRGDLHLLSTPCTQYESITICQHLRCVRRR